MWIQKCSHILQLMLTTRRYPLPAPVDPLSRCPWPSNGTFLALSGVAILCSTSFFSLLSCMAKVGKRDCEQRLVSFLITPGISCHQSWYDHCLRHYYDRASSWSRYRFLVPNGRCKVHFQIRLYDRNAHSWRLDLHDQNPVNRVVVQNLNVVAHCQR